LLFKQFSGSGKEENRTYDLMDDLAQRIEPINRPDIAFENLDDVMFFGDFDLSSTNLLESEEITTSEGKFDLSSCNMNGFDDAILNHNELLNWGGDSDRIMLTYSDRSIDPQDMDSNKMMISTSSREASQKLLFNAITALGPDELQSIKEVIHSEKTQPEHESWKEMLQLLVSSHSEKNNSLRLEEPATHHSSSYSKLSSSFPQITAPSTMYYDPSGLQTLEFDPYTWQVLKQSFGSYEDGHRFSTASGYLASRSTAFVDNTTNSGKSDASIDSAAKQALLDWAADGETFTASDRIYHLSNQAPNNPFLVNQGYANMNPDAGYPHPLLQHHMMMHPKLSMIPNPPMNTLPVMNIPNIMVPNDSNAYISAQLSHNNGYSPLNSNLSPVYPPQMMMKASQSNSNHSNYVVSDIQESESNTPISNTNAAPNTDESNMKKASTPTNYNNDTNNSYNNQNNKESKNLNRGNYRCGKCGQPKVNHVCQFVDIVSVEMGVQVEAPILNMTTLQPLPGEKFLTVRSSMKPRYNYNVPTYFQPNVLAHNQRTMPTNNNAFMNKSNSLNSPPTNINGFRKANSINLTINNNNNRPISITKAEFFNPAMLKRPNINQVNTINNNVNKNGINTMKSNDTNELKSQNQLKTTTVANSNTSTQLPNNSNTNDEKTMTIDDDTEHGTGKDRKRRRTQSDGTEEPDSEAYRVFCAVDQSQQRQCFPFFCF
jgi:hypothetical protein